MYRIVENSKHEQREAFPLCERKESSMLHKCVLKQPNERIETLEKGSLERDTRKDQMMLI